MENHDKAPGFPEDSSFLKAEADKKNKSIKNLANGVIGSFIGMWLTVFTFNIISVIDKYNNIFSDEHLGILACLFIFSFWIVAASLLVNIICYITMLSKEKKYRKLLIKIDDRTEKRVKIARILPLISTILIIVEILAHILILMII